MIQEAQTNITATIAYDDKVYRIDTDGYLVDKKTGNKFSPTIALCNVDATVWDVGTLPINDSNPALQLTEIDGMFTPDPFLVLGIKVI